MSIALHSGQLAAAMYLAGESAGNFQRRLHQQLNRQVKLATVLSQGLLWAPSRAVFVARSQAVACVDRVRCTADAYR